MWTDTTRAQYARAALALPSDLTDDEWALLEPFFPPASHVGRPRKWPMRRIVEGILYLLRGGLPWRMLPPCFPPVSTVRRWFYLWRDNGLWLSLNHALLLIGREAAVHHEFRPASSSHVWHSRGVSRHTEQTQSARHQHYRDHQRSRFASAA